MSFQSNPLHGVAFWSCSLVLLKSHTDELESQQGIRTGHELFILRHTLHLLAKHLHSFSFEEQSQMSSKSHIPQIKLTNVQKSWFRILPLDIPPFSNPTSNDPTASGAAAKDNTGMAACAATRMESFTTWKSFQS